MIYDVKLLSLVSVHLKTLELTSFPSPIYPSLVCPASFSFCGRKIENWPRSTHGSSKNSMEPSNDGQLKTEISSCGYNVTQIRDRHTNVWISIVPYPMQIFNSNYVVRHIDQYRHQTNGQMFGISTFQFHFRHSPRGMVIEHRIYIYVE